MGTGVYPILRVGATRLPAVSAVPAVRARRTVLWLVARVVILVAAALLPAEGKDAVALLTPAAVGARSKSRTNSPKRRLVARTVVCKAAGVVREQGLRQVGVHDACERPVALLRCGR